MYRVQIVVTEMKLPGSFTRVLHPSPDACPFEISLSLLRMGIAAKK
jgi:hypothetical protein